LKEKHVPGYEVMMGLVHLTDVLWGFGRLDISSVKIIIPPLKTAP
jgi:hypothetical protein